MNFDIERARETEKKFGSVRKFAAVLNRGRLADVLAKYIHFNSVFAGSALILAGKVALCRRLFRDPSDSAGSLSDRSAEISQRILDAQIDEFGDRAIKGRFTHRMLAAATLTGVHEFLGVSSARINEGGVLQSVAADIKHAYLVDVGSVDESRIFHALGFYVAAEDRAQEEFLTLDGFLRERCPNVVRHLEKKSVRIVGRDLPAYHWIDVHGRIEEDHARAAVEAVELALKYYAGDGDQAEMAILVLRGYEAFCGVRARFMRSLAH